MTKLPAKIARSIVRYESQAGVLRLWTQGLSRSERNRRVVPGKWTVQELAVHMLDSDLAATHRMRRIAAEDLPLLIAYDESAFVKHLPYAAADIGQVCDLFELNRRFTAGWLRALPAKAFSRLGVHNQRGKLSLAQMVTLYADHVTHHEPYLREKRRKLRKPLG
jgi:uncharacterized damage-inducible protein DinB